MSEPALFSAGWAEGVRAAVDRGPGEDVRATKLPAYWEWIDRARAGYGDSWALGVRDLPGGPAYLRLGRKDGVCADATIVGPDEPLQATSVLDADLSTWRALLGGADPGRIVMYRGLRLREGDVLRFFRGVYLFVESLAVIGRVPARLP